MHFLHISYNYVNPLLYLAMRKTEAVVLRHCRELSMSSVLVDVLQGRGGGVLPCMVVTLSRY